MQIDEETYRQMEDSLSLQEGVTVFQQWRLYPTREEEESVLRARAS